MGKQLMIVVLGFIVLFGTIRNNLDNTTLNSAINASEYAESVIAKNVAASAVNRALAIHSESGVDDTTFVNADYLGGSYTATIAHLGTDSASGVDTIQISATGTYEDDSYTTIVRFMSGFLYMPDVTSSIGVESDCTLFDFNGNIQISGIDTDMDGSTGPGPNKAGMTFANDGDTTALNTAIASNPSWVQGDPDYDVDTEEPAVDIDEMVALYASIADLTIPGGTYNSFSWGTADDPTIIYSTDNITLGGSGTGYGVLAVNGALKMKGNVTWYGIIMASGGDSLVIDASVGSPSIYGAFIVGATITRLTMKGNADIFYSSEAIAMVQQSFTTKGIAVKIVTEKSWWE